MYSSKQLVSLVLVGACNLYFASGLALVPQVAVFEGENAEIPCNYDGSVFAIDWKKGDDIDTATVVASFEDGNKKGSDGGRITVTDAWSLSISSVKSNDHGTYYCEISPTDGGDVIHNEFDFVVKVPPDEPFPTLAVVSPSPTPPGNASCDFVIAKGTSVQMTCSVDNFRPRPVRLDWLKDDVIVAGTEVNYEDTTDGLLKAYGGLTFTVGDANMEISCEASGEVIQGEPKKATAVICATEAIIDDEGGGSNGTKIAVIVIIVLLLVAALVGLIWWMQRLIKDTMVRSNYSKSVSADDDTPAKSRMSNYCHFIYVTICPCLNREELYDAETGGRGSSRSKEKTEKKHTAPSAALKARIQQNRKKQESRNGAQGNSDPVPSELQHENSPMLDDTRQPTAPSISAEVHVNDRPPGARPKTRPNDDVIIRDPSDPASGQRVDEGPGKDEAETGF